MAKRFHETNKWDKPWYRKLPPEYKCLWDFILSKCDMAGVWDIDFEGAEYSIGLPVNEHHARIFFRDQIHIMDEKKWFVIDFVKFQYGEKPLNPKSPIHKKVSDILTKYSLHNRVHNRVKYKEEEKEEDKDKEKEHAEEILNSQIWIEEIAGKKKLQPEQVTSCLMDFITKESLKPGSLCREISEIKSHFINWFELQLKNTKPVSSIETMLSANEFVKSLYPDEPVSSTK